MFPGILQSKERRMGTEMVIEEEIDTTTTDPVSIEPSVARMHFPYDVRFAMAEERMENRPRRFGKKKKKESQLKSHDLHSSVLGRLER
ncbi:hypothetical protein BOTCAL_0014g00220 [Botryotinia calthae]|uniref:Uncharacterized protein n=1 Tax=Botryotinia calthae TaxID=38488 RepID=A0A4Y8DG29_9HELO|nr:hypothetical protein BOTCAL_0014g00220 [Botryotinia calthae]